MDPPPLMFKVTPDSLLSHARGAIIDLKTVEDKIVRSIHIDAATFENVLLPIAHCENRFKATYLYIDLLRANSPVKELRNGAKKAIEMMDTAILQSSTREDLFLLVDAAWKGGETLDSESQRLLDIRRQKYIFNGFGLSTGKREELKVINERLLKLRTSFGQNLVEDTSCIWLSREDLAGVPEKTLQRCGREAGGNNLRLKLKKQDVTEILKYCHNARTRKEVFIRHQNICAANVPIFEETVRLRNEAARLLGYESFAAMRLVSQMAKSPGNVGGFLEDLTRRLKPKARLELEKLKAMKREEVKVSESDKFYLWDFDYYHRKMLQREFEIDSERIAGYFPASTSIRGLLDIFQDLFGLVAQEISANELARKSENEEESEFLWREDVRLFSIRNDQEEGGEFVGYLYVDMYSRDGKSSQAWNFSISPGFFDETGTRHQVATALICSISKPTAGEPSLLKHNELVTIFHELGHGMHDLLSKTQYSHFHGYECVVDFIEAPSQLLENFCWVPEQLRRISRHYSYLSPEYKELWQRRNPDSPQPPKQISDELITSIVDARHVNEALTMLRQVGLSVFDMTIHGSWRIEELASLSVGGIYNDCRKNYGLIDGPEVLGEPADWGNAHATTIHFMENQAAAYYSYLYTRVFSADIFAMMFKDGVFDNTAGRRYRHQVLEKGGSRDEMEGLTEFLGRRPNADAFEKELGIFRFSDTA